MRIAVLWFRRDLRLEDNPIAQIEGYDVVVPIFIVDPWFFEWKEVGKARTTFMFESLVDLDRQLHAKANQLLLFHGDTVEVVTELLRSLTGDQHTIDLYVNTDIQTEYGVKRDQQVKKIISENGNFQYLESKPSFMVNNRSQMSNWVKGWYSYNHRLTTPSSKYLPCLDLEKPLPFQTNFNDIKKCYPQFWRDTVYFPGGSEMAVKTLDPFVEDRFRGYHWKLSRPWLAQQGATSHLSPHIMMGTISPRQVYKRVYSETQKYKDLNDGKASFSLKAFIDRIRWRDSFTQRLLFNPALSWQNRFPEFDGIYNVEPLSSEKKALYEAWMHGKTGFALIDASMRQLREMGWMNFRMRAMCATFLTINLGISWHWGAQHYMNYLVDGDMAIDSWQWQMQSGITNPLAKSFRIYNPSKNLKEKDPDLDFVYHWVPELQGKKMVQILDHEQGGHTVSVWIDGYTKPIVDLKKTRLINGRIVSDIRSVVRNRIMNSIHGGSDLQDSLATNKAVSTFTETRNQQYHQMKNQTTDLFGDFSANS